MRRLAARLSAVIVPAVVLLGLVLLDLASQDTVPMRGLLTGVCLATALGWAGARLLRPLQPTQAAWASAWRSVLEGVLGVVLVFALSAPLALLLPAGWADRLYAADRVSEWIVLLLLGAVLAVAARAWGRAARSAAQRVASERDAANARAELAERDRELAQTELRLLKAQVEPHFLWNTLGALGYLMRHDADRAQRMLELLTTYLRSIVADRRDQATTLKAEFASIDAYLQLMRLRMGDRFDFDLDLPPTLRDAACPSLLLQPLVENAIKHGLEPQTGPVRMWVRASEAGPGRLRLEVRDNGVGLQPKPRTAGTGLGLSNIRERLRLLHGDDALLRISAEPEGGVRVQIEWTYAP
ncbi:histidine kinase [Roseateles sp.]|uniref:sensor histidine kinase n=1 Tax=Roseateles sp. TaxID=1971397 RepID=UPI0031D6C5E0